MESNEKEKVNLQDLFVRYSDAISKAREPAVREALLMHEKAGNSIAVSRDGRVVILRAEEIEVI